MNRLEQKLSRCSFALVLVGGGICGFFATSNSYAGTIWDGGASPDTSINNAANWDADSLPDFLGTASVSFGTTTNVATINTDVEFTKVTCTNSFTLAAGAGKLSIRGSNTGGNVTLQSNSGASSVNINEEILVKTLPTAAPYGSLFVIANNRNAVETIALRINSGIALDPASTGAGTYTLRYANGSGGLGDTRIAGTISGLGTLQNGATAWTGDLIIAGNQSLASANISLSSGSGFGNPTANARLLLGETSTDIQTWNAITLNNVMKIVVVGDITASSVSGSGAARIVGTNVAGSTLRITSGTIGSNIDLGGVGAGENDLNLVKDNSGILTIAGAKTYTGTTTVSGGSLYLTGSLDSATTVNGTGTLADNGTLNATLDVQAGGTLAPGTNGIGTFIVNNTVTLGGSISIQITGDGGITNDVLSAPGQTINFGGTLNVTDIGTTAFTTNDTFSIFQAASLAGSFSAINLPVLDFGLAWDTSQLNSLGIIKVVAAPIAPPIAGYTIQTFGDEFNDSSVDPALWNIGDGYSNPGGRTNVSVYGGSLHLETDQVGTNWITGWVSTKNFVHKYGVWVSRYRIAQTNGLNNAFWTATVGGNPWDDIEIDINEGRWPYSSIATLSSHIWYHPVGASNTLSYGSQWSNSVPNYWAQYHTNVLEWRADNTLKFYLDGVEYTNSTNGLNKAGVMAPQNLIFSTHYFDWAGPGIGLTNTSMDVDYVRVFQKPGWNGAVSGSWTNTANWGTDGVPSTNFAALFNQPSANTTITLPSDRYCQSLYFDNADTPSFTFAAGNNLRLGGNAFVSSRGGIILGDALTTSQIINVNMVAERELEFGNYSTTPGVTLDLNGTITGTSNGRNLYFCGRKTINLNSSLSSSIFDIRKFGNNEVWLNAANSHTGTNYVVGGGRIIAAADGALGSNRSYCGSGGSGGGVLLVNGVNYTAPHTVHLNDDGYFIGSTLQPVFGVGDASEVTFGGAVVVDKHNAPLGATTAGGIIHLTGAISGASSNTLSIIGSGTVSIEGNNTFTGPIAASLSILAGNGIVRGPVTKTNGRLNPGTPAAIGTLTVSNSLTLAGSSLKTTFRITKDGGQTNDKIVGLTSVTFAGQLIVTNIGVTPLVAGDSFQLFAAGSYNGAFTSIILPPLPGSLVWNTNNLAISGRISVVNPLPPAPTIDPVYLDGGNIVISAPTVSGAEYVLETTPGLEPPVTWTPVITNSGNGGTITNLIPVNTATPQSFYRYEAR
jgi:autotransporter-associated beta strand protein